MDDTIITGDKSAGPAEHKTFDWQHVWKSVEDAGTQAGNAVKKQVDQIDTKELGDKAKHAASEGLKVARGKSDYKQANEISDAASKFVPGAGLIRKGAELAHETGADGKVLEGKQGPLHAPSDKTLRETGKAALGTAIPIPGMVLAAEVLNRSGVKDRIIDAAIDTAKSHSLQPSDARSAIGSESKDKHSAAEYPPKIVIEDSKQGQIFDSAKAQIGKLFQGFHKPEASEPPRN
jgi:hypothetical protein